MDPAIFFHELQAQAAALRERLRLRSLRPGERRACLGKWFADALRFCATAAQCQERHAEDLGAAAPDAAAIRAQMARVVELELCLGLQERLLQDLKDTLLHERAQLYRMATAVLDGLVWLGARPGPEGQRDRYAASIAQLRAPFERRNEKVRKSKRERAALREGFVARAAPLVARCAEAARQAALLQAAAPRSVAALDGDGPGGDAGTPGAGGPGSRRG